MNQNEVHVCNILQLLCNRNKDLWLESQVLCSESWCLCPVSLSLNYACVNVQIQSSRARQDFKYNPWKQRIIIMHNINEEGSNMVKKLKVDWLMPTPGLPPVFLKHNILPATHRPKPTARDPRDSYSASCIACRDLNFVRSSRAVMGHSPTSSLSSRARRNYPKHHQKNQTNAMPEVWQLESI